MVMVKLLVLLNLLDYRPPAPTTTPGPGTTTGPEVHKLVTPSSWALLYESVTEELTLRAKCAAHALCVAWTCSPPRCGLPTTVGAQGMSTTVGCLSH